MKLSPSIQDNILRVLCHLKLEDSVIITRQDEDRVWGWPSDDSFLRHVVLNEWWQDSKISAQHYHGGRVSFRERGVRPALQVVFHPAPPDWPYVYFLELDLDENSPATLWGKFRHGVEVLGNMVSGSKTRQDRIAELLDERKI